MFSMLIGLLGAIVALIGWFVFHSEIALIIGIIMYLIETIMEWKQLNVSAKLTDLVIFIIGFCIGLFISTPAWICGLLALSIYSLIIGIISILGFAKF